MKIQTSQLLTGLLALLFLGFCIPKLSGNPISLALFEKINSYTGWTGGWFRIMTGLVELSVGLFLVIGMLKTPYQEKLHLLGLLASIGTMCGAIFTELAIRPGEDLILTVLAFLLLGLSVYLIWPIRHQILGLIPGMASAK